MVYRCILPKWLKDSNLKAIQEGIFSDEDIKELNVAGYNIYNFPNYPSHYTSGTVDGTQIDTFNWVFVDMDLKDGKYPTKESFIDNLGTLGVLPTRIIDSGNGVHVYWFVSDLDAISFLRLQRRLMRYFDTDPAVAKICQLMRVPGTFNTKQEDDFKLCEVMYDSEAAYSCEDLDKVLPPITLEDEQYCQHHYNFTYNLTDVTNVNDEIPLKFAKLLSVNKSAADIWSGKVSDRSEADWKLAHIMLASGFTREEALSVLLNAPKAMERAPHHRLSYAQNITDKIWIYKNSPETLSRSVRQILERGDVIQGTRFPCYSYIDATDYGFRLSHVIGLVAGSGVGKTSISLNMFMGFVQNNPDYVHFFVPLEQKVEEIAVRWQKMCQGNEALYDKVQLLSNYTDDGQFRHLSLSEIKEYILKFEKDSGKKVGCVVIDHIAALKKESKNGENQRILDICLEMKNFAVETNTLLMMQSQAPREKAKIGDVELDKDAAYGTVLFESFCDYLITMWQPLKRCYSKGAPLITAFKFCKIRHKNVKLDKIQEDCKYTLVYEPNTDLFRLPTQEEEKATDFWKKEAANLRDADKKKDVTPYTSITWTNGTKNS